MVCTERGKYGGEKMPAKKMGWAIKMEGEMGWRLKIFIYTTRCEVPKRIIKVGTNSLK